MLVYVNLIEVNFLLSKSKEPIKFQLYFSGANTNTLETIVDKLYQFRNDIAHGNMSDFDKDLSIFKNRRTEILKFLIELLRKILIFAIENPQLTKDLKEC